MVLGIETSCDETACALVDTDGRVRSSVVSSQLAAHRPFGGVVPEIASREHLRHWPEVLEEALAAAGLDLEAMAAVAATRGPGLVGSLLVGLSLGKALARGLERPFYGIHHLEGHLVSPYLESAGQPSRGVPARFVALVVSGGHTALYEVDRDRIRTVAQTRDDAIGEVFDKVGKHLGLLYPQGPRVDELAEAGTAEPGRFAIARCSDGSLDFSYSGLKTETMRALDALPGRDSGVADDSMPVDERVALPAVRDVLASFRAAAVEQVLDRLERLWRQRPFEELSVSGGAAANRLLRRRLPAWAEAKGVRLALVELGLSGDNAAMIAFAGARRLARGQAADPLTLEAASRLALDRPPGNLSSGSS